MDLAYLEAGYDPAMLSWLIANQYLRWGEDDNGVTKLLPGYFASQSGADDSEMLAAYHAAVYPDRIVNGVRFSVVPGTDEPAMLPVSGYPGEVMPNPDAGKTPAQVSAEVLQNYGLKLTTQAGANGSVYAPYDSLVLIAEKSHTGDFIENWLNGPGPLALIAGGFLALTAFPAISAAVSSTPAPYLDTFDLLPDPTITYNPLSSPITDLPVTDAIENLSPSYPMPEPAPPPAPVDPGEYVPFEEGYPSTIPNPPTITDTPITTPEVSNPGSIPSLKMPTLSDLPKLVTSAVGAGLAIKNAVTRNQLQSDLLKSQAYLPTTSLVPGLFPGTLPFGSSLDPGAEISQTIANFVKSPLFWAGLAAVGIVLVTRKG